jgi:CDP-paratose 2-epimerase
MTSTSGLALITGGAGFIATNVAERLLREGWRVRLFDNLSRSGVIRNVEWLQTRYPSQGDSGPAIEFVRGDVRDPRAVRDAVAGVQRIFHFAAQVAVTTSLVDPRLDFEVNARGTLNVLEAVRALAIRPSLLFTSTNKVYGRLNDVSLRARAHRCEPEDATIALRGISERRTLDFHSPYGCSKGAAEQYVLDYARTFGIPAAVFRMSCIYGPHQFGTEDQGWVAHFVIRALNGLPLTIYGDGLQVRDVLFVDDLVDAMMRAHDRMPHIAGEAFNIGGGPARTISLFELTDVLTDLLGRPPACHLEPWRTADQRYYVSDTTKFQTATGWMPHVSIADGIERLMAWVLECGAAVPALAGSRVAS